ncbi:MAG: hypothetical protein ACYSWQ_27675, partial [Planctomycetota bacterium]
MDFLNQLLPLACEWAERQQEHILQNGISLTESQIDDARLVPVSSPEKVRLLKVDRIPWPENPMLLSLGQQAGFFTDETEGLAIGYGIFIKSNRWQDRRLIVHELVHVSQYERLGGISQFLQQYVTECLTDGYDGGP